MPPAHPSDYASLSLDQLTALREHALSWLCHDKGLVDALYPPHAATPAAPPAQRRAHATAVVHSLLTGATEAGRAARARVFTREAAARLRRMTDRLRDNAFTHRDVVKMSLLLETLWDDANTDLSDHRWARCSMRFDTALITLRVTYVLAYLRAELAPPESPTPVRRVVFKQLVDRFFMPGAPTDDSQERHSAGFKALRAGWHAELSKYALSDAFEHKIDNLSAIQTPAETARYVLSFIRELGVDHAWLLDAVKLNAEARAAPAAATAAGPGRRRGPSKSRKKKAVAAEQAVVAVPDDDEGQSSSSSSFEPAAPDSDFDAEGAAASDDAEDDDYENAMIDSPETRRLRRSRRTRRDPDGDPDGDIVRRSLRVARAGVKRRQSSSGRVYKGPERFSELEYPTRHTSRNDASAARPTRAQMARNMAELVDDEPGWEGGTLDMADDDDAEPPVATRRSPRTNRAAAAAAAARPQRTSGRKRRLIRNEDDDVPLVDSRVGNEVTRQSQRLDPDSQTFESTGMSDADEVVATMVRKQRVLRALDKVKLRSHAVNDEDEEDDEDDE